MKNISSVFLLFNNVNLLQQNGGKLSGLSVHDIFQTVRTNLEHETEVRSFKKELLQNFLIVPQFEPESATGLSLKAFSTCTNYPSLVLPYPLPAPYSSHTPFQLHTLHIRPSRSLIIPYPLPAPYSSHTSFPLLNHPISPFPLLTHHIPPSHSLIIPYPLPAPYLSYTSCPLLNHPIPPYRSILITYLLPTP